MTVDHPRDLLSTSSSLTLVGATRVLEAALAQARSMRQQFCIAVTDPSGEPIVTLRMDGAPRISAGIALNKAYTVCGFGGMPTESWNTILERDQSLARGIVHTNRLVVFGGGVGVRIAGALVGAIGVSGGTTDADIEVATAGAASVEHASA
jgi:uncharacterized protein GlcG (DUF336 family)